MVRIEAVDGSVAIMIDCSPKKHEQPKAVESAWRDLCARNARYFNGKILAFDSYDHDAGIICASIEQYKHHAVRDAVDLGLYLLAVTGVLVAADEHGHKCVLLGKRSPTTHRYGDLWEFGPSGGIDVPDVPTRTLDLNAIVAELGRETMEEAGIQIGNSIARPIALVHDDYVRSTDLAIMIGLPTPPTIVRGWEYLDCRWVDADALKKWVQTNPDELIPATLALAPAVLSLLR